MIRAEQCDASDVRQFLDLIALKADRAGVVDLDGLIARGKTFRIIAPGGETVGAYVLAGFWPLLWVMAAGGRVVPGMDLSAAIMAMAEQQGAEFDEIGFRTERRGLVRKAQRLGYVVTRREGGAYFLRKKIND